jgi:hypothetical protein
MAPTDADRFVSFVLANSALRLFIVPRPRAAGEKFERASGAEW